MKKVFFVFLIICIALIVCGIIVAIFRKKIKCWFWKQKTKQALKKLPKDKYRVLNNIFIQTYHSFHQIDHLVISKYGIFVIMTKQYTGEISGRKFSDWFGLSGIKIRRKSFGFPNPIRQNYYHVKALAELLSLDESKIFNIACFPSRARLSILPWDGDGVWKVAKNTTIVNLILSYNDIVINDINSIIEVINSNSITDRTLIKKHIINIKRIERIRNMKNNIVDEESDKCPECGSPLRFRYGRFRWIRMTICSNYFNGCKYIKSEKVKDKEICDCLICGGKIIEKGGFREKVYYECSNYPECKAAYIIIANNYFNMLSSPEEFEEKNLKY